MKYRSFGKAEYIWLIVLGITPFFVYHFYLKLGFSALVFLLLVVWASALFAISQMINKRTKTLSYALKAFVNEDPTFALEQKHPLAKQFNEIYQKLSQSKFNAAEKADYLSAVMVHLDSGLLIVDDHNQVLQSNPKSEQLIGHIRQVTSELGQFGDFVLTSNTSRRGVVKVALAALSDSFSVQVSVIQIDGKRLKLITFQSINQALTSREYQAYSGLTKVLTHEVLNSITPMQSLSQTALEQLKQENKAINRQRLAAAMATIVSRSKQLTHFIESFKQLNTLPKLVLKPTVVGDIVSNLINLHNEEISKGRIEVVFLNKADPTCLLDPIQVDLCVMNLLKNAIYSATASQNKKINIHLYESERLQILLDLEDFGEGIEPHVVDNIFIPFFTTKANGSGIGLSLSKQIMSAHGGDLLHITKTTEGALFRMVFP